MEAIENFDLKSKWVIWFHQKDDNNWSMESYKKVFEIKTYYDLLYIMKHLTNVSSGMFFLMREGIKPIYEDEKNMNGGYWSLRLVKNDTYEYFKKIAYYMVCEDLMKKGDLNAKINGISICPKINNCIVKIWNSDYTGLKMGDLRKDIDGLSSHFEKSFYLQHSDKNNN
jgi:hypothetical protein